MQLIKCYKKEISIFLIIIMIFISIPLEKAGAAANFSKGETVSPSKFNSIESNFEPDAGMLLIDMTNGKALEGAFAVSGYDSPDVKRLVFLLVMLDLDRLEEHILISNDTDSLKDAISDLKQGDMIKVSELLKYYMYTTSSIVQDSLMQYFNLDYDGLIKEAKRLIKNSWVTQTELTIDNMKSRVWKTSAYDLYALTDKLLGYQWFKNNIGQKEIEITWTDINNENKSIFVKDNLYSEVSGALEGLSLVGHFTAKDQKGSSQIIISLDKKSTAYISVILGNEIRDNLAYISEKVYKTLKGVSYLTMKEEELLKQTPEPTAVPEPTETLLPTEAVPTAAAVPTESPTLTEPPLITEDQDQDITEVSDEPADELKPTKAPSSGSYSTPTSSYSSIAIPKENYNLERYGSSVLPIGSENEKYQYLLSTNEKYYTFNSPPPGYKSEAEAAKNMVTITVPVWKMNASGSKYSSYYDITINKKLAASVKKVFEEIYKLPIKFPIKVLKGYAYREVGGIGLKDVSLMSMHSYGAAIDINPGDYDNDYYLGAGNDLRDKSNPYCIPDEVIKVFEDNGWNWGGNFNISADTMHFQYLGLDYLSYQGKSPFRNLKVIEGYYKGLDVWNLQARLKELGYRINVDGVYGKETESVVIKFQKKHGLKATGVVDYKTWETVINLTHYMQYVF